MVILMDSGKVRKYTQVGGYPIFYASGSDCLCPDCALLAEHEGDDVEVSVNFESELVCGACENTIERAYEEL